MRPKTPKVLRHGLSPSQSKAINLVASTNLVNSEIASSVGIAESTLYDWLKKPRFLEAFSAARLRFRIAHGHKVDMALIHSASNADSKHGAQDRKTYYELQKEIKQADNIVPIQIVVGDLLQPDYGGKSESVVNENEEPSKNPEI